MAKGISDRCQELARDLWSAGERLRDELEEEGWGSDDIIVDGTTFSFGGNFIEMTGLGGEDTPIDDDL